MRAAKVTVRVACTTGPNVRPVRPSTPDGMSTDTVGPVQPASAPATNAASPSSAPRNPVPYIASTASVGLREGAREGALVDAGREVEHVDRMPQPASTRAAITPSPPLLPLPQTTTTRRP